MNVSGTLIRTADIASAYLKSNSIKVSDIAALVQSIYDSLAQIGATVPTATIAKLKPAVSINKSITPDYLICLEDGHSVKMLKRYLRTNFGMTPHEYRMKWGLPMDYPMAAPNYILARSKNAIAVGFGKHRGRRSAKG